MHLSRHWVHPNAVKVFRVGWDQRATRAPAHHVCTLPLVGRRGLAAACPTLRQWVHPRGLTASALHFFCCGEPMNRRRCTHAPGVGAKHGIATPPDKKEQSMSDLPQLSDAEQARYEWQMWTPEVGEEGQRKLKAASVLVSRIGGVGGTAAYYLAAAGVGKLVLAHAGGVRSGDLNRQLLMTTDWLDKPRIESAERRLRELNPHVEVVTVGENVSDSNAASLVGQVDFIVDAAPLFVERFAMNRAAVEQGKPLVECAMFDLDAQLTTIIPKESPCLRCLYPVDPPHWKREFPVFGAVAGMIGAMAAMEIIKLITGIGEPLKSQLLCVNLRTMEFRKLPIARVEECLVCGTPPHLLPATGPAGCRFNRQLP